MRLLLVTLAHAQLVVDWTAKSTFDHHEARRVFCTSASRLREAARVGLGARRPGAVVELRGPGEGQATLPGGLPPIRAAAAHGRRGRCGNHRHRRVVGSTVRNLMYTQVETVVGASVVGTIYSD